MFKLNLDKANKKVLILIFAAMIPVLSLFGNHQQTKAVTFKGWSNYGWRGDKQSVGQVNGEGKSWVATTAYINNQCGQRWSPGSWNIVTVYSDWCYGTAYSYWYYA